ncbi:hypothetical protein N7G274_010618 [Stereocaulon virgatum]|uniref:Uncharacterized protein n=1 Tax=Stereocaulon virgatum TaxID=373712 RepID=A0ABR4A014_9LECA
MNKGFGALDHQIAKIQGKLPTAGSVTYRDVVVKGMDSGARPTGGPRTSPAHNKNAEVVVKIDDKEAARALRDMGPTKLTEKANELIDHLKAGLPRGYIFFHRGEWKEAEKLRENTEWAKSMGEKARTAAPVFGVLVHGAPANGTLPIRDGRLLQKEAIEYIKKENKTPVYEPGLEVVWAGFTHKIDKGTNISPLILQFETPEQANAVIRNGLSLGKMMYSCKVYLPLGLQWSFWVATAAVGTSWSLLSYQLTNGSTYKG